MSERITGGCQCGAVRYALHETPSGPHICHCRMCQKAFGSFFAPLTGVPIAAFEVTRGTLRSSRAPTRPSAASAGTAARRSPSAMSSGRASRSRSARSTSRRRSRRGINTASRAESPGSRHCRRFPATRRPRRTRRELAARIAASNHQHPDHDTAVWPPRKAEDHERGGFSGGCQCGAVRFRVARLGRPSHLPLPHVPEGVRRLLRAAGHRPRVEWTRGEPKRFPELQPGAPGLLRRLRHAAHLRV